MLRLKKFKATVVAIAAIAGLAVTVTPAQAADTCNAGGGGLYICDYGVTNHALPNGQKEQFLVGLDYAVWTRWTISGQWTGWVSLGKPDPFGSARATNAVKVEDQQVGGDFRTTIYLNNSNGPVVSRTRLALGSGWTPWDWPNFN